MLQDGPVTAGQPQQCPRYPWRLPVVMTTFSLNRKPRRVSAPGLCSLCLKGHSWSPTGHLKIISANCETWSTALLSARVPCHGCRPPLPSPCLTVTSDRLCAECLAVLILLSSVLLLRAGVVASLPASACHHQPHHLISDATYEPFLHVSLQLLVGLKLESHCCPFCHCC